MGGGTTVGGRRARAVVAALLVLCVAGCGPSDPASPATPTAVATSPEAGASSPEAGVVTVSTLDGDECPDDTLDAAFPDVVAARFTRVAGGDGATGGRAYRVDATLCSRYDTPERYADAWRVVTPFGEVLGTRELLHDHASEQPFTRSLDGDLVVPDGVTSVLVEARDLANGWGGASLEVELAP